MSLAGLLIVPPALVLPMASFDEAWYASVARNVVKTGDWLTFQFNGEPFWEKPPVGIWMIAACFSLFGVCDFVARISAILCGLGCVLVVFQCAHRQGGLRIAVLAALLLLSAQDFVRFASKGQFDVPLTLFLTAQLVGFWEGLQRPRWHLPSGLFLGLALATKNQAGLIGLMIQGTYILLAGDVRVLRQWQWYSALLIGAMIAAPWFVHQYATHGQAFLDRYYFINYGLYVDQPTGSENAGASDYWVHLRYLSTRHNVLLAFAVFGLVWAGSRYLRHRDRWALFLAVWVVLVPAIFTGYGASHYWYLMPMYPGVALLSACAIAGLSVWERHSNYVLAAVTGWVVAFQLSYYVPPPKESMPWATKHLAEVVRAHVPSNSTVYLLLHPERKIHRAVYRPGAHYYFDRVAREVRAPQELIATINENGSVFALVDEHVFNEVYKPWIVEQSCETIAQAGQLQFCRIQRVAKAGIPIPRQ